MYNDKLQKSRRRELREAQTEAEGILWEAIRGRKFHNLKFRRQYSVGPYILDFFCPDKRLAIELDGEQHKEAVEYDKERDEYLGDKDIQVLRFWNYKVVDELPKVLSIVAENARLRNTRSF